MNVCVVRVGLIAASLLAACGCGTTKSQTATEQLLMSDAIDRSVANIDFTALAGEKVYLDTQYIQPIKGFGFVNSEYIISSLRQQLVAANCLLQEKENEADYVVEARVGALGTNMYSVTYGVPSTSLLSSASAVLPNAPPVPTIPEISFAKRDDQRGAAKIGVFAYHRETKQPVWQAGISQARSEAGATWILGIGPFQRGTIYDGTRFAGSELSIKKKRAEAAARGDDRVAYDQEHVFPMPWRDPPTPLDSPAEAVVLEPTPDKVKAAGYQQNISDEPPAKKSQKPQDDEQPDTD